MLLQYLAASGSKTLAHALLAANSIKEKVATVLIDLIKDSATALFVHLDFCSDGNEVLKSWVAGRIDRCSVLTIVALSTKGQIVCRSQMPDELAVGILANQVTEVFAMVIFVVGKAIEYHTTVHFLYILWLDL